MTQQEITAFAQTLSQAIPLLKQFAEALPALKEFNEWHKSNKAARAIRSPHSAEVG